MQESGEDNDDDTEVDELFSQFSSEKVLSLSEMLSAEEEIPICAEFAESSWSEEFMASLGPNDKEVGLDNSDEDEDDKYVEHTEPPPPRMKNLTEVIDCSAQEMNGYLEGSYAEEATRTDELLSAVTRLKCSCSVQASITQIFSKKITPLNLNDAVSVLYTIHCHDTLAIIILYAHCNDKKLQPLNKGHLDNQDT